MLREPRSDPPAHSCGDAGAPPRHLPSIRTRQRRTHRSPVMRASPKVESQARCSAIAGKPEAATGCRSFVPIPGFQSTACIGGVSRLSSGTPKSPPSAPEPVFPERRTRLAAVRPAAKPRQRHRRRRRGTFPRHRRKAGAGFYDGGGMGDQLWTWWPPTTPWLHRSYRRPGHRPSGDAFRREYRHPADIRFRLAAGAQRAPSDHFPEERRTTVGRADRAVGTRRKKQGLSP